MQVKVRRDVIGYGASVHLNDAQCSAAELSDTHVLLKTPLDGCGTERRSVDGTQVYTNNVHISRQEVGDEEKREPPEEFPFRCSYKET